MELNGVEFGVFGGEFLFDGARKGEVDIVAAEEDVFADSDAFQGELAIGFADRDQREISGAAADVDDQDFVTGPDAFAPVGVAFDPCVEGGLRLFQQDEISEAGAARGVFGEAAGGRVERSGNGDENLRIPDVAKRLAKVVQVGGGSFQGRNARHAFGGSEGEERGRAVNAGVG